MNRRRIARELMKVASMIVASGVEMKYSVKKPHGFHLAFSLDDFSEGKSVDDFVSSVNAFKKYAGEMTDELDSECKANGLVYVEFYEPIVAIDGNAMVFHVRGLLNDPATDEFSEIAESLGYVKDESLS